jgi:hypothetical protein
VREQAEAVYRAGLPRFVEATTALERALRKIDTMVFDLYDVDPSDFAEADESNAVDSAVNE